jgi:hypothetical protein
VAPDQTESTHPALPVARCNAQAPLIAAARNTAATPSTEISVTKIPRPTLFYAAKPQMDAPDRAAFRQSATHPNPLPHP